MKNLCAIALSLLFSAGILSGSEILVPDHHKTVQSAIDAAKAGDLVLVSPGVYEERIVLKPGITVKSKGDQSIGKLGLKRAEETILDGGGEIGDTPGVRMAEGAILDGLTVRNVGVYDEAKWQKSWEEKGANQSHEHIGHFGIPGIAITGVTCVVTGNIVHHVGDTGIAIRGEESKRCSPLVSGNVCYRNMGGGIGSMMGSTAIIDGNTCFENFYAGIGHDDAAPIVTRNECYGNIRAGIGVSEGACPTVRGNRCYQNRKSGIGIRTSAETRPIIEDNDCFENEMAGIGSDEEAAPIIRGNRCYRNKLVGIGVDSSTAILIRNRVEKNEAAGIGINGKSKGTLLENVVLENRLVAVGIPGGAEVVLQGNTLVRTGGMPPVVAILGGSKVVLTGNTIQGGGVAAVMVQGQLNAIDNRLEGQNGGAGFFVRKGSDVKLDGNQISGYRTEVRNEPNPPEAKDKAGQK